MMPGSGTIRRLLQALADGQVSAGQEMLLGFRPWLHLLARLQLGGRLQGKFDASDIAQQTLLEACRDLPKFRGRTEAELLAWLRQILAHVLGHEIRRFQGAQQRDIRLEISLEEALQQSSQRLGDVLAAQGSSPSHTAAQRELEVVLAEVLAKLPDDYREVIVLRNLEGLPHEEVARRMQRSVGATRMLWARALKQLRQLMKGPTV